MNAKEIYDIRVALYRGQRIGYNHEVDLGLEIFLTNNYKAAEEADAMYKRFREEELAKQIKSIDDASASHRKHEHGSKTAGNSDSRGVGTNGGKSLGNIAASATNQ